MAPSVLQAIEFEHRDLHISNILLRKTSQKLLHIKLYGKKYTIATHGIKATIIDYTLSRIKQGDHNSIHALLWLLPGPPSATQEMLAQSVMCSTCGLGLYAQLVNISCGTRNAQVTTNLLLLLRYYQN